jgi:hypothetical protein
MTKEREALWELIDAITEITNAWETAELASAVTRAARFLADEIADQFPATED